jgi:protein-tyrosine phosphatase
MSVVHRSRAALRAPGGLAFSSICWRGYAADSCERDRRRAGRRRADRRRPHRVSPLLEKITPTQLGLSGRAASRLRGHAARRSIPAVRQRTLHVRRRFPRYQVEVFGGYIDYAHNDYRSSSWNGAAAPVIVALGLAGYVMRISCFAPRHRAQLHGAAVSAGAALLPMILHSMFRLCPPHAFQRDVFATLAGVMFPRGRGRAAGGRASNGQRPPSPRHHIDLHCHMLPGIDDGSPNEATSLEMARIAVADGIRVTACTPHIYPGLYENDAAGIKQRVMALQRRLFDHHMLGPEDVIRARLDERQHVDPRQVPPAEPHRRAGVAVRIAPPRFAESMFDFIAAGYVPVLTHRALRRIKRHCEIFVRLKSGVWMQIRRAASTAASAQAPSISAKMLYGRGRCISTATGLARRATARRSLPKGSGRREVRRRWSRRLVVDRRKPSSQSTPARGGARTALRDD